ncbi:MAG: S26 family signal peptidase [Candidatus Methanogaster sp.]|uniref:S26 family signal peptidase n=1 Tax=Candidatus Methanogaster sp. TaxID=3386292 RepID=A0AC61L4W0_9EURY|nr:MAG: S26 family signal peptidase [ANME-2 cluster archaeon]
MNNITMDQARILRYCKRAAVVVVLFTVISVHLLGISARTIGSESMGPNMHIGDLVFIRNVPSTGIVTREDGATSGYRTFGDYGNVILYRKYGRTDVTPIIHRAMYYVEAGEPMWDGGPVAPHAGYITKGDNNYVIDQHNLCTEPIREEWIDGVACFRVPYTGYARIIVSKILR